jgi:hypothetical protein
MKFSILFPSEVNVSYTVECRLQVLEVLIGNILEICMLQGQHCTFIIAQQSAAYSTYLKFSKHLQREM